jgi:hypothetical protein
MANIPTGQEFPSYSSDNTVPIWGIMSSPPLDWRSPTTILRAMRGTFDISLPGATVFAHVYLDTTPLWIVQVTSNKRFIHTWCGGEDETYADYRSTNARYRVRVSVVVPPSRNADMAVVWYMWLSRMCEAGNEHILDYVSWQGDEAGAQEALEFFENPRIGVLADALEQRVDAEQDRVARMMEAMWTEVLDEQTRMVQEVMDRVLRLVNGGALPSVDEGPTGDQVRHVQPCFAGDIVDHGN